MSLGMNALMEKYNSQIAKMESNHLDLDVNQADYHYLLGAFSGERGNRTPDTVLFRHMLYQLSYFTC